MCVCVCVCVCVCDEGRAGGKGETSSYIIAFSHFLFLTYDYIGLGFRMAWVTVLKSRG